MSYFNTPTYTQPTVNSVSNLTTPNTDIQMPKATIQATLGLRQIQGFEMLKSFTDSYGKSWKLVKSSTDDSVEIPDPQLLQITDYWNHEFPGSNGKIFVYVVEGIKYPRDESLPKINVLYQWFSTSQNKQFTPQMITPVEWHKANVYSSDLCDAKLSKLYALCKVENNHKPEQPQVQQNYEPIEDINLNAIMQDKESENAK